MWTRVRVPLSLASLPVGVRIQWVGSGLGYGVGGRWAFVAQAEDCGGVFLVVEVNASAPEDAVGGAEHGAAAGVEEDVG